MVTMSPELSHRLADAFAHRCTPEERGLLIDAAEQVETFDQMPADAQHLTAEIESRPLVVPVDDPDFPHPTRWDELTEDDFLNGGMAGAIVMSQSTPAGVSADAGSAFDPFRR